MGVCAPPTEEEFVGHFGFCQTLKKVWQIFGLLTFLGLLGTSPPLPGGLPGPLPLERGKYLIFVALNLLVAVFPPRFVHFHANKLFFCITLTMYVAVKQIFLGLFFPPGSTAQHQPLPIVPHTSTHYQNIFFVKTFRIFCFKHYLSYQKQESSQVYKLKNLTKGIRSFFVGFFFFKIEFNFAFFFISPI